MRLTSYINSSEEYLFSQDFKFLSNQNWCLPKKDKNYFIKRYLKHPIFKYYFLSILNGDVTLIGRVIKYNGTNVFHVVDIIGDINGLKISKSITSFLKNENIDLIELMIFDSRGVETDLLKKNKKEIIPTYFNPFEYRNIKIEFSYKANGILPVRFFLGDSDQDRPN